MLKGCKILNEKTYNSCVVSNANLAILRRGYFLLITERMSFLLRFLKQSRKFSVELCDWSFLGRESKFLKGVTSWQNLVLHRDVLSLMILSFILVTCFFFQVVILWGEISYWSLLGLKGLNEYFLSYTKCSYIKRKIEWFSQRGQKPFFPGTYWNLWVTKKVVNWKSATPFASRI